MKPTTCLFLCLLAAGAASAQLEKPVESPIVGPRRPALSPDGQSLAFVYRGDIWMASIAGIDGQNGRSPANPVRAVRLTDHVEYDNVPLYSPDGEWIAFSSNRNGNADIYVMPATGGAPRQITFSGWGETAWDWSPDGKSVIFSASRDLPDPALFATDVKTLQFRPLFSDYRGVGYSCFSPDGKIVLYNRQGFPWTRPRYAGSAAAQVWAVELETGKRRGITPPGRQHLWPRFLPDGKEFICVGTAEVTPSTTKLGETLPKIVDNERRTPNVWAFSLDGKGRQVTHFVGGAVRWPTVARRTGDIAFEYGDAIWLLRKGARQPVRIPISAPADDKESSFRREVLTSGVDEAEISPDGKTIAFGIRGEIWSIPTEKPKKRNPDQATRLTDWAGYDGDFWWTRDGKKLIFTSDREGSLALYELDVPTQAVKLLWKGAGDAYHPQVTPDGKQIAFWVAGTDDGGLYTMPVGGGPATRLVAIPGAGGWQADDNEFAFSPDMQWLAYTRRSERGAINIWVVPVKGGDAVNVTRLNAYHGQIRWSPDGRYLFFRSNREGWGIYALPLKQEDARPDELELKFSAPKETPKVEIDFEDIHQRIRRLSSQDTHSNLCIGPDGTFYFLYNGDVWSVSYDGKETKRLTNGGGFGIIRLQDDGKKLMLVKQGQLFLLTLGPGNPIAPVTFVCEWEHDVREERHAAFVQFWRAYNRSFYDPNFHGRDWSAIRARYEPLLDSVGTRDEFATVLSMMVGELEASHTEVGPAPGPPSPGTALPGFLFDYTYGGPGIRILDVPEHAPGSYPKTRLKPGEYVMAINGKDVRLDERLFQVLNYQDGKDLELLVNANPTKDGARKVTYRALSGGEWGEIFYRNRIDRLRAEVEKRSGGRIAYVHLRGMGGGNYDQFEREFYEYTLGKDAVIVDVRFNGGGNIADSLTRNLAVKPYAFYRPRGGLIETVPGDAWDKPMVVLINESSFSNAEMFPYDMKQTGLATLIGQPTPGYVIWTSGFTLLDGTSARMPGSGVWRKDGTPLENNGQQPDILVDMTAEDWLAQRDPQLEAAVDYLLKR